MMPLCAEKIQHCCCCRMCRATCVRQQFRIGRLSCDLYHCLECANLWEAWLSQYYYMHVSPCNKNVHKQEVLISYSELLYSDLFLTRNVTRNHGSMLALHQTCRPFGLNDWWFTVNISARFGNPLLITKASSRSFDEPINTNWTK